MVKRIGGVTVRVNLLSFILLLLVLLPEEGTAEVTGKRGKIQGESYVNLRSGPDLSSPPRAVLRKGEEVTVEREEKSWYLVSLRDGRRGYVYKTFVRLLGKEEIKAALEEAVAEPGVGGEKDLQISSSQRVERQTPKGKPLPIIKVIEGKEWEILRWFVAALCIFIIGWICGGNYYLRRDRIQRSKLRF